MKSLRSLERYTGIALMVLSLFLVIPAQAEVDRGDAEYIALRDSLTRYFNEDDSAGFARAVTNLEDYCLKHDDLHIYYTQRCNEIVFLLNRMKIVEAYKLSLVLSKELRERKLDKEYYMAINMMGHIYNYCGNKEMARKCFTEVLERMEKEGYRESMPPIYMNLVEVVIDDNPEEGMRLLDKAAEYATTPDRLLGIDTYRTIYAYKQGDMETFMNGYRYYKECERQGLTSVHANTLETYYLLSQGDIEGAIRQAKERANGEEYSLQTYIYEQTGDWKMAYETLQKDMHSTDSINSMVLTNSMQGIQNELELYEAEHTLSRQRIILLSALTIFMLGVIAVLVVYNIIRRRHEKIMREARDRAMESDRMKSAFISNISHEIRTPLNIIGGFMQVLSDPTMEIAGEERKHITGMVLKNTNLITSLVDEMLELSHYNAMQKVECTDDISPNKVGRQAITNIDRTVSEGVEVKFDSDVDDGWQMLSNHALLLKILYALLDNAVKSTTKGSITLLFRKVDSKARFIVEDTGCGIPGFESERIFGRFEKLDNFKEGLGLGLPLARELARRMGGDVMLDTSYVEGARFVVELPIAKG